MKSLKRILANLTMVCMLASVFPMTFVQAAETETGYNFSSDSTEFNKYGDSGVETKTGSFNVTKTQFEDSGNLLVFTYDAYVPDFKDEKQTLYLQFKGGDKVFALGAKIGFLSGKRRMYAYNKGVTENVGSISYTNALAFDNMNKDASGGQWVNLKTVIKYDSTNKAYVSWNYFNGKAIVTSENEVAKITYTPTEGDLSSIQERTSIGYTIGARCGADTEDKAGKIKVANIGLSVYSTTEFEKTIEVASEATEVTVPVTNAKFKNDTTAPTEVKGGLIDVSNAAVTAVKNGTAVSGVTAANAAVAHSGSVNVADGSAFKLSGLPALVKGDVLNVTITNAMDANGTLASIELILYGAGTEQAITYSLKNSTIDKNSKKISVKVDAEKLFVDKDASGSAKIICASYSDAGVLLGVSVTDMNISNTNFTNGKYQYTSDIGYTEGAKEVKVLLFDNMENIKPLTEFQPFDI